MLNLIGTYFSLFHVLSRSCCYLAMFQRTKEWRCESKIKNEEKKKKTIARSHTNSTHKSGQLPNDKIYIRVAYLVCALGNLVSKTIPHALQTVLNWTQLGITSAITNFRYNVDNFYYYRSTWILSFDDFVCVTNVKKKTEEKKCTSKHSKT